MRVYVYYRNPEGQTERVLCFGKDEKELQKDVDKTLSRLGWDKPTAGRTKLMKK